MLVFLGRHFDGSSPGASVASSCSNLRKIEVTSSGESVISPQLPSVMPVPPKDLDEIIIDFFRYHFNLIYFEVKQRWSFAVNPNI